MARHILFVCQLVVAAAVAVAVDHDGSGFRHVQATLFAAHHGFIADLFGFLLLRWRLLRTQLQPRVDEEHQQRDADYENGGSEHNVIPELVSVIVPEYRRARRISYSV